MAGIVRAGEAVSFWRVAQEQEPPEEWEQQLMPPAAEPEIAAPAVSKSNKFLAPANKLKKLLDTAAPAMGEQNIPHDFHEPSTTGIQDFADANPAFLSSYFKPDYADMLKAHLGEDNYAKLLHHGPHDVVNPLSTHVQKPPPASNKYVKPTNTLNKLLSDTDPHNQSQVSAFLEGHPAFAKTYLHPSYQDALEYSLGDNYPKLLESLSDEQHQKLTGKPKDDGPSPFDDAPTDGTIDPDILSQHSAYSPQQAVADWKDIFPHGSLGLHEVSTPHDLQNVVNEALEKYNLTAEENNQLLDLLDKHVYPNGDQLNPGEGERGGPASHEQVLDKPASSSQPAGYDPQEFAKHWKSAYPSTTWKAEDFATPEEAKKKLEGVINEPVRDGVGPPDDYEDDSQYRNAVDQFNSDKEKAKKLYEDWFGNDSREDEDDPFQSHSVGQQLNDLYPQIYDDPKGMDAKDPATLKAWLEHDLYRNPNLDPEDIGPIIDQLDAQIGSGQEKSHGGSGGGYQHDLSGVPSGFVSWATSGGVPISDYSPEELQNALSGYSKMSDEAKQSHIDQELAHWYNEEESPSVAAPSTSSYPTDPSVMGHPSDAQGFFEDMNNVFNMGLYQPGNVDEMQEMKDSLLSVIHDSPDSLGTPGDYHSDEEYEEEKNKLYEMKMSAEEIYDKYFGTPSQDASGISSPDKTSLLADIKKEFPASIGMSGMSIDQIKAKLEEWKKHLSDTSVGPAVNALYDKYFGAGAPSLAESASPKSPSDGEEWRGHSKPAAPASPPSKPEWNPKKFSEGFKSALDDQGMSSSSALYTGDDVASSYADPAKAEAKLDAMIAHDPDSALAKSLSALKKQWFGGSSGGLDEFFKSVDETPGTDEPEDQIAAEDQVLPADFKSQQADPAQLEHWTQSKPTSPAQWKNFATWWGNTQIDPGDEQSLYESWFDKPTTPEKANAWFAQLYHHQSQPGEGDLGADGIPGWAHAPWAFGQHADQVWPLFRQWASNDPGIPSGADIKARVKIWNSLSDEQKSDYAADYLSDVDSGAVLKALKKAFPDADFAKWKSATPAELESSVKALADAGFAEGTQIYNDFYHGDLPMPIDDTNHEPGSSAPAVAAEQLPPLDQLPWWAQKQIDGKPPLAQQNLIRQYVRATRFAESVGDPPAGLGPSMAQKKWSTLPGHIKATLAQMPDYPWSNLEEFEQWQKSQPTAKQALVQLGVNPDGHYAPDGKQNPYYSHLFNYPLYNGYDTDAMHELARWATKEGDPQRKMQLANVMGNYYGFGEAGEARVTLGEGLDRLYPGEGWDEVLQNKTAAQVFAALKKKFKTETDSTKFAQLVDLWIKHSVNPNSGDPLPTGVPSLTKFVKQHLSGSALSRHDLTKLKYFREKYGDHEKGYSDQWTSGDHFVNGYVPVDYPFDQTLADQDDFNRAHSYLPFVAWSPPSGQSVADFKMSPAAYLKSKPKTQHALPDVEDSGFYGELIDRLNSFAPGVFSDQDKAQLKSKAFTGWFANMPVAYQKQMRDHPGLALDDFQEFFSGGSVHPPTSSSGADVFHDLAPVKVPTSQQRPDLPSSHTYNKQRWDQVKFPRIPDAQETLPLGPGERFAPNYAPMPIYRIQRLKLDHEPSAPSYIKDTRRRQQYVNTQRQRLRQIDQIINGDVKNRERDLRFVDRFAQDYRLTPQNVADLKDVLFGQQGDLFSDDKWHELKKFGKDNGIPLAKIKELADKIDVSSPPDAKGNYDDPRLAQLILDYMEDYGPGGLGTHYTRDIDKAYHGIPAAGHEATYDDPTDRSIPVLISALTHGLGEDLHGSGAFDPRDKRELEHSLKTNSPILLRRLQIMSPDKDFHDLIDHGPISEWTPGRDESLGAGAGSADGGKTEKVKKTPGISDKPSLALQLNKAIPGGVHDPAFWDELRPGHAAEHAFYRLIKQHPGAAKRLEKLYQMFFVGRPDLTTKPHVRRASVSQMGLDVLEHQIERLSALRQADLDADDLAQIEQLIEEHSAEGSSDEQTSASGIALPNLCPAGMYYDPDHQVCQPYPVADPPAGYGQSCPPGFSYDPNHQMCTPYITVDPPAYFPR